MAGAHLVPLLIPGEGAQLVPLLFPREGTSYLCSSLGRALLSQRGFGAVPVGVEGSRPGQEELRRCLAHGWDGQVAACYRAQRGS